MMKSRDTQTSVLCQGNQEQRLTFPATPESPSCSPNLTRRPPIPCKNLKKDSYFIDYAARGRYVPPS